jgi:glycosyltransferase involved in cell wall biosynthesis
MSAETAPTRTPGRAIGDVVVLVPAYNPDEKLLDVLRGLFGEGFARIVVVDDGSAGRCAPLFEQVRAMPRCTLLTHAVNLGKGRALKTGLNHILLSFPDAPGVVTVDADGQHLAPDVARVVASFLERPTGLVLGSRSFGRTVPLRSLLGNVITRGVFRLLAGARITDTQSGLRCFTLPLAARFLRLEGERYEYEMNMLIEAHRTAAIREVGISTVYIEDNRSSHFNPLVDSMKIYFLLLRFSFSSVFAGIVDLLVFAIAYRLSGLLLASFVTARVISGGMNFALNRGMVFHSHLRVWPAVVKYYLLVVALGTAAYFSIRALADLGFNVIAAKILTETVLFLASFAVQRDFIFASSPTDPA